MPEDSTFNFALLIKCIKVDFSVVGHNNTDMLLWLSAVRKLPAGYKLDEIEEKLKNRNSAISNTKESCMWLNFYLSIII